MYRMILSFLDSKTMPPVKHLSDNYVWVSILDYRRLQVDL